MNSTHGEQEHDLCTASVFPSAGENLGKKLENEEGGQLVGVTKTSCVTFSNMVHP